MRVTRNTADQLRIEHRAALVIFALGLGLLFPVAFGIALVLSGEWMGWPFLFLGTWLCIWLVRLIERVQVILDRPSNTLTLRRRSLQGYKQDVFDLDTLVQAELEVEKGDEVDSYRAFLVLEGETRSGRYPLTLISSSIQGHRRVVNAINAWLGNGVEQVS